MLVYEHRSSDTPPAPWFSSDDVRDRCAAASSAVSEDLRANERAVGLAEHRAPDPTFAAIAHAWVAGEGFAEVVGDDELTGGDFVRTVKQLIDLLRQLALIAPDPADAAVGRCRRRAGVPRGRRRQLGRGPGRSERMTIKPAEAWGRAVERPANLVTVTDDATLAALLGAIRLDPTLPPVGVGGGDLARTVGGVDRSGVGRSTVNELPIDLLTVRLGGARIRSPPAPTWWRARRGGAGSWWRGPVLVVMNAEFLGSLGRRSSGAPERRPGRGVRGRHRPRRCASGSRLADASARRPTFRTRRSPPGRFGRRRGPSPGRWRSPSTGADVGAAPTMEVDRRPDAAIVHV